MENLESAPLSGKSRSSNKKIILYAVIGILAVAAVSLTFIPALNPKKGLDSGAGGLVDNSKEQAIATFEDRFCGDGKVNSNAFVTERILPNECEMPLGITVDGGDGKVWYMSTKQGTLGSYSPSDGKFEEFAVPSWPARSNPTDFSMSWAVRADGNGSIWFTDDKQSQLWRFTKATGTFDSFKSPASNPISFDFDSDGNMYLVGVRSKSLFFGDVSQMKPGMSEGFTEIKLPLDAFSGVDNFRISSGSVSVDNERKAVWTSVLAFQEKGQIYRYDITTKEIKVFDLPQELSSPVGTTVDSDGNLWVTDHGTSVFFMVNAEDGSLTRYVTSVASSRIYGGTTPANAYTLPYWIEHHDGSIWFNQHEGNKINRFDPSTQTMVEYWIPTQNQLWANCPEGSQTCGVANTLQMAVSPQGEVWFTEWSENKIGTINRDLAAVPLAVSAPDEITVSKGKSAEVKVEIRSDKGFSGSMVASGTMTNTGDLGGSSGIFSEQSVDIGSGDSKQVSYVFTPAGDLAKGQYILMVGAENGDVTVLKAIRVNVV